MSDIKIKYDENGSIVDAFDSRIEIDGNYIIVDSSIWSEYSKYSKEDLKIEDSDIVILNNADKKLQIIKIKAKALIYLADTAWYIERLNDPSSGKAIPEEVLTKRIEARELINTLEAELKSIDGAK